MSTSRILVGVEGSPDSMAALRWASEEARRHGATLHIVHAYQIAAGPRAVANLDRHAQEVLDVAVKEAADVAPEVVTVAQAARGETAAEALLSRAADADLLVVGCRGMGGFSGLLLGSVSSQCAHHAPCPIVIVRPPLESAG